MLRRDREDEKSRDANPVMYKVAVHSDVRADLPIPVASGLKLVKAIFESILVVRAVYDRTLVHCEGLKQYTYAA